MPVGRGPHLSTHDGPGCPLLPRAPPTEQLRRLRAFSHRCQTALGTRRRRAFDAQDLGAAASSPRSCVPRRSSRHSPNRGLAASGTPDVDAAAQQRRCAPSSRANPTCGQAAVGPRDATPRSRNGQSHSGAVTPVTAPVSRDRGSRIIPVILLEICNELTGSDARGTYEPPNPRFGRRLCMLAGGAELELGCQEEGRGRRRHPRPTILQLSCLRQGLLEATATGLLKPERSLGDRRGDRIKGETGGPHTCSSLTHQGPEPLLHQSR